MESRGQAAAAAIKEKLPATPQSVGDAVSGITASLLKIKAGKEAAIPKPPGSSLEQDPTLRQRLKDAESAAKQGADSRFRNLQGAQKVIEISSAKAAATAANEKSVAGRKMIPTSAATEVNHAKEDEAASAEAARQSEEARRKEAEEAVRQELKDILARAPVVIFSKSYCPYSLKGKRIMTEAYTITPAPYIVELDQHSQGRELQALLHETTGRRTVPNILVNGKTLGGGDDAESLWRSGKLAAKVKEMGMGKIVKVVENSAFPNE